MSICDQIRGNRPNDWPVSVGWRGLRKEANGEETFESRNYGTVTAKLYTVKRRKLRDDVPIPSGGPLPGEDDEGDEPDAGD